MGNIYRIPLFRTWPFVGILGIAAIQVWALTLAFSPSHIDRLGVYALLGFVLFMAFLQVLVICLSKLIVEITEGNLAIRRPGEFYQIPWQDIQRIERIWTMYGGSFVYQIVTNDGRRLPAIPDFIENCQELLALIQQRSGKRIVSETKTISVSIKEDWQKLLRFFQPPKKKWKRPE